ncbi:MAG TPA: outer membrane protein assembly factor BamA [Crocinitomix sp.]|nr:outer membrane protein assembly factor BamA [Crocinitomix sp.]
MKKIKYILGFLFVLCATQSIGQTTIGGNNIDYLRPKKYIIAATKINGVPQYDNNAIRLISGLTPGKEITVPGDDISNAINALWDQGLFSDVEIVADKVVGDEIFLSINLKGRPKLSKYKFTSADSTKKIRTGEQDDLRDILNLYAGKTITESLEENTKNLVRGFFQEKGFLYTNVDIVSIPDTSATNSIIYNIIIDKGNRIKIKHINVYGNEDIDVSHINSTFKRKLTKIGFSDGGLRRSMKDTKQKGILRIFSRSKFNRTAYERDRTNLIAKFNEIGLIDAKILRDSVYKIDDKHLGIDIYVDKGDKYYFGDFTWVGNTKYTTGQLDTLLGIKKGEVFNQSLLDQRLFMSPDGRDITSLYMDRGYLFFNLQAVEANIDSNNYINYEIRINEGKEARIGEVRIYGNTKTNDYVIRREIRTKPGDLFSRADIIRTQRELSQLGYFDNEQFQINPIPNPADGTVDIEYTVVEKSSDQIELSGGYGGGRLIGTLGLTFTNFSTKNFFKKEAWQPLPSGDGQRLSIRGQTFGRGFQSYNLSFTEPWLGGKKPTSFTTFLNHSLISNGLEKTDPNRFHASLTTVGVGLGKRLKWPDDYFSIYTELSYTYYDLKNYEAFVFENGYSNDISLKYVLSRNSVDTPIYPRGGSNFTLTLKGTLPYSLFDGIDDYSGMSDQEKYKYAEYYKVKFTGVWYMPISKNKKLVLVPKFGYGFMGGYSASKGNTPFQRFYLGGNGLNGNVRFDGRELITLRGYNVTNGLSPLNGSALIAKYSVELRYPLSLNPNATIYGLAFVEAGNVYNRFDQFDPFNVKRAAGAGVRVFLPMFGMLGVDFAWGFDPINIDGVGAAQINSEINSKGYTFGFFPIIGMTLGDL